MRLLLGAAMLLLLMAGRVFGGQAPSPAPTLADLPPVHRLAFAVGGLWLGGASLGAGEARLRGNQSGGAPPPYVLFGETSRLQPATGVQAEVGIALTRAWAIEGSFVYTRPQLRISVSSDVEGAAPVIARDRIDQYVIDAGVKRHLRRWTFRGRFVPFIAAGAGYLRQLHQGLFLIETGTIYRVGGGLTWWLSARDRGFLRATALRLDGRVYAPHGGFEYSHRARVHPAFSASAVLVF